MKQQQGKGLAERLLDANKHHKRWLALLLCLAIIVSTVTVTVLTLPGETLAYTEKVMDCPATTHTHSVACYNSDNELICGMADYLLHTHSADCYDEEGNLVCTLPEISGEPHTHTEECYNEAGELICGLLAVEEHVHTAECFRIVDIAPEESSEESAMTAEENTETAIEQTFSKDTFAEQEGEANAEEEKEESKEESAEETIEESNPEEESPEETIETIILEEELKEDEELLLTVKVEAGSDTFPEGTTMEVKKLTSEEEDQVLSAIEDTITEDNAAAKLKDYQAIDITFRNADGQEIEPQGEVRVTFISDAIKEAEQDEETTSLILHVDNEGKAEILDQTAEEDLEEAPAEDEIVFDTDSFSVYVIAYTVDFEYELNGEMYYFTLSGGEKIALSELIEVLGILNGTNFESVDAFLDAVENVEFSDESLVSVTKDEEGNDWTIESLEAFDTTEALTIALDDGQTIVVKVTDAQYTSDLNSLLTDILVTINGEELEDGQTVKVDKGDKFSLHLEISENDFLQFPDDTTEMVYQLPDGITLDSTTSYITIDMGIDGKVYRNKLVYDPDTNTLRLTWNTKDPNFSKMASNDNTKIIIDLSGSFNSDATHVEFSDDLSVDIEHEEHHDANINKAGQLYMPGADGNPYDQPAIKYTVTVTSDGTTTVNVNDVVEGSAVTLDTTNWTATSNKGTTITPSFSDKGFSLNNQSLEDGEVVTITYWGLVDTSKISNVTNVTYSETGNKVTLTGDDFPDKEATHYEHQVGTRNVSKYSANVENTGENEQTVSWVIRVNDNPTSSIAGSTITDSIAESSRQVMSYDTSTKPYLTVKDASGNVVSSRSGELEWSDLGVTDPSSQKTWTYTIPVDDGVYSYEISYKTIVDTSDMPGWTSVSNNVDTQNGSTTGTANVGPKPEDQKYTITKNKVSVDEEKTTWSITVTADPGEYDSFVITDIFPTKDYYGRYFVDGYEIGSAKIVGLEGDEWVDIVTYQDYLTKQEAILAGDNEQINKVEFVFYQDGKETGDKSHPGLSASSMRTFTVELTSINSKAWIEEAKKGENEGVLSHQNTAMVNNVSSTKSVEPMSKTVFKYRKDGAPNKKVYGPDDYTDPSRSGGVRYPMYTFRVIIGGANEDTIVIDDYFDTDLFQVYIPDPMDRNKAPQFFGGNGDPKYAHEKEISNYDDLVLEEGDGKVTFTATNIPKDDGAYYSFYMLEYNLIPKSEEAWNIIKQKALEDGGETIFSNVAKYDESESDIDFKYNYNVIDKSSETEEGDGNTPTLLKYTIDINPDMLRLNNGEVMTMTDTYTSNLSVDFGSITVTAVDKDGNDRSSEVTWDYRSNVGTFTIPDETHVILKYSGRVLGEPGSVQTVSNTAYMEGYFDTETKEQIVDLSGSGTSERVRIRLLKFAADHMEGGLDGAVFRLLDQDKNPVIDINGNEVTYTTSTGYLNKYGVIHAADDKLDYTNTDGYYYVPIYRDDLTDEAKAKWDRDELRDYTTDSSKLPTYADLNPEGMARLGITLHSGFAEIYMNQQLQGVALKKERVYYLEEIKTPVGPDGQHYEKTNVKYSFLISDQADYSAPSGIYVYHNNDVMTVRNWPSEEATLQISKTFIGNVELTEEQKNKVTFTIKKKNSEGIFEDFLIDVYNAETGEVEKKATFTYGDKRDAEGTPLFVNGVLTIEDIESGEYQVVESNTEITDTTETIKYRTEYLVDGDKQIPTDSGVTVTITDEDIENNVSHDVAVTNSYFTNKYEVKKYAADTAEAISGAKFKIVRINSDGTETVVKEDLETDSNGRIDIRFTSNSWDSDFEFDTQVLYYVVETNAANGYVLPDEPDKYYFYFSSNPALDTSDWTPGQKSSDNPGGLPSGETAVDLAKSYGTAAIPNRRDTSKTYITVNKKWVNALGRDITSTMTDDEAVSVKLYRTTQKLSEGTIITNGDTENSNTASELKTLTIKSNGTVSSTLYFLPGDKVQITAQGSGLKDAFINMDQWVESSILVSSDNRKSWMLTMGNYDVTVLSIGGATEFTGISASNTSSANRVYKLTKSQAENVTREESFSEVAILNASGNWTYTFSDLDVTETSTGINYFYYVVEDEATVDTAYDVESKSITVTNKAPEQLEVNKRWEDYNGNSINNEKTDGSITYELYQVENPLSVGPYTGTGIYSIDYSRINPTDAWDYRPISNLSGNASEGKIKVGSTVKIEIVATSQSNQSLEGDITVTGATVESDTSEDHWVHIVVSQWYEYDKWIDKTRTIILKDVTSDIVLSGYIQTDTSKVLYAEVIEEPTDASSEWDDLTKSKIGELVVSRNNVTLTKDSSYDGPNFRVATGTKAWSSLIYNLPSSGKKDGKTVNYTYYVVEKAVSGFTTTYQVNGKVVEYTNAEPGDTVVIVNRSLEEVKGSVKVTKNFSGITEEQLPTDFKITASWTEDGVSKSVELTTNGTQPDNVTLSGSWPNYTWTIAELPKDTVVTFTETGYDVAGYNVTITGSSTADDKTAATATANETPGEASFTNTYEKKLTDFCFTKEWQNSANVAVETWDTGKTIKVKVYKHLTSDTTKDSAVELGRYEITKTENGFNITKSPDAAPDLENVAGTFTFKMTDLDAYGTIGNNSGDLEYYALEYEKVNGYKDPTYKNQSTTDATSYVDGTEALNHGKIINKPEDSYELPQTGGSGTHILYLLGSILIAAAGVLLLLRRRTRGGDAPL